MMDRKIMIFVTMPYFFDERGLFYKDIGNIMLRE